MPFTLIHVFVNYLLALPVRKRIDIIALLLASFLPDLEGLYFMIGAYDACPATDIVCLAEYPSHFLIHSFLGIIFIIAPLTVLISMYLRKRWKIKRLGWKIVYASAIAGGLLHLMLDLTKHKGADALYLLWPLEQQFSFAIEGADIFWAALAGIGLFLFVYFEWKKIQGLVKR